MRYSAIMARLNGGEIMSGENDGRDFSTVLESEYQTIMTRRNGPSGSGKAERQGKSAPENLFGVALSGGGIRSASFCLGVLQALHARGLTSRMDYLSTVSGGGYIGASMVAAMSRSGTEGEFPFSTSDQDKADKKSGVPKPASSDDVRDSEPVSHIRDHSRYLIPGGMADILPSLAIVLRGLAVNIFLVLALIVPLAAITVIANPTTMDLHRSIFFQVLTLGRITCAATSWCAFPFVATTILGAFTFLYLLGWGLWRSLPERHDIKGKMSEHEVRSRGTKISKWLIAITISTFLTEAQGPILAFLHDYLTRDASHKVTLPTVAAVLGAFATVTAGLRATLVDWIEKAMKDANIAVKLRAMASKAAFMAAGLIVPLLIYTAYLALSLWGIADEIGATKGYYSLSPGFLFSEGLAGGLWVAVAVLAAWEFYVFVLRKKGIDTLRDFFSLLGANRRKTVTSLVVLALATAFLIAAAIVTRQDGKGYDMVELYLLATAIILMLTINFSENANGLHRLYRERLSVAFRLGESFEPSSSLSLSALSQDKAPYLLINTTLNARQRTDIKREHLKEQDDPKLAETTLQAAKRERGTLEPDPVKRGRNAEFFLFSRNFVGSDMTGYVPTERLPERPHKLDLATAVAISGAAVSSSMGRVQIGLLRPTLALLNLRLGYWMLNPRFIKATPAQQGDGRADIRYRRWYDFFRAYLVVESFGLMSGDAAKIYLTDGGHIDNIGLYQLLKRKCRVIIVSDAEADPAMTFGALVDVERFARIDLGVRIDIKWQPVRMAALNRNTSRDQYVPETSPTHDCHFAIGEIDYGNNEKGVLLYIKAAVTGDEPDYVLDYERRFLHFRTKPRATNSFRKSRWRRIARLVSMRRGERWPNRIRTSRPRRARRTWSRCSTT